MASGHVSRIKRPNTWLHRPMLQNVKKVLANPEPSTHGTFRTWRDVQLESAICIKTDVRQCLWRYGFTPYTEAPLAFGRRRCSSSRGMISTKLQGRVR
jgi:hypothetical protein